MSFNFKIVYLPGNLNEKADRLTKQSENLLLKSDKRFQQQSRIVLKLENLLEIHSTDFISDASSDIFSDNSLSNIDDLDLAHLELEIRNLSTSPDKKNSLELEDDINPIDSIQLWSDAYANTKDPVHNIIISL